MLISIAGCATQKSNYCLYEPLRPSVNDVLTQGTKQQIVKNNLKYEQFCGKIK